MDKKIIGNDGEQQACDYIESMGARISKRNFRCKQGEIDIIGYDGKYLFFAEVKTRNGNRSGSPYDAVNSIKQRKISKTALFYMYQMHVPTDTLMRFDVISIQNQKVIWIKNAFEYSN